MMNMCDDVNRRRMAPSAVGGARSGGPRSQQPPVPDYLLGAPDTLCPASETKDGHWHVVYRDVNSLHNTLRRLSTGAEVACNLPTGACENEMVQVRRNTSFEMVPAGLLLYTQGAHKKLRKGVPLEHCAHYYDRGVCWNGEACGFAHILSVDTQQEVPALRATSPPAERHGAPPAPPPLPSSAESTEDSKPLFGIIQGRHDHTFFSKGKRHNPYAPSALGEARNGPRSLTSHTDPVSSTPHVDEHPPQPDNTPSHLNTNNHSAYPSKGTVEFLNAAMTDLYAGPWWMFHNLPESYATDGPKRFVACAHQSDCPFGNTCTFLHIHTPAAVTWLWPVHCHVLYRDMGCLPRNLQRLSTVAGACESELVQVWGPKGACHEMVAVGLLLYTQGAHEKLGKRAPLEHCAHYYFNGACKQAEGCAFAHILSFDSKQKVPARRTSPPAVLHGAPPPPTQKACNFPGTTQGTIQGKGIVLGLHGHVFFLNGTRHDPYARKQASE